MSVEKNIYTGMATYGRVRSIIGFIVGFIIAIIIFIVGIFLIKSKDKYTKNTIATIKKAKCEKTVIIKNRKSRTKYDCMLDIKYTINNKDYENTLNVTNDHPYSENGTIEIQYNETDPLQIRQKSIPLKYVGSGSLSSAILLIIVVSLSLYFTLKYKAFAAVSGTVDAVSDISYIVRN